MEVHKKEKSASENVLSTARIFVIVSARCKAGACGLTLASKRSIDQIYLLRHRRAKSAAVILLAYRCGNEEVSPFYACGNLRRSVAPRDVINQAWRHTLLVFILSQFSFSACGPFGMRRPRLRRNGFALSPRVAANLLRHIHGHSLGNNWERLELSGAKRAWVS